MHASAVKFRDSVKLIIAALRAQVDETPIDAPIVKMVGQAGGGLYRDADKCLVQNLDKQGGFYYRFELDQTDAKLILNSGRYG